MRQLSDAAPERTVEYGRPSSLYGVTFPDSPFIGAADTARLMGFPTREALAKARRAGRLPIQMMKLPGRRGWFATRAELWHWLQRSLEGGAP
jgi:hypothetical protein